ncbi:MAG: hypothetical protein ABI327_06415 [Burkholderiaceae bacterium]
MSNPASLRDEIAAVAARLIAEDGFDYAGAKRRAAREVLGEWQRSHHDCLPDNAEVEAAVREHQALFMAETQPGRLLDLRLAAREVMRFLDAAGLDLTPFVNGAIVNGTAGDHSDIHLQVFDDNAKDLEIFLLNAGVDFEVSEGNGPRARSGEILSFLWPQRRLFPPGPQPTRQEAVHLLVLDWRDQRAAHGGDRADLRALEALIAATPRMDAAG